MARIVTAANLGGMDTLSRRGAGPRPRGGTRWPEPDYGATCCPGRIPGRSRRGRLRGGIEISRAKLDSLRDAKSIPGLSITISVGGLTVWSEGRGYADLEQLVPASHLRDRRFVHRSRRDSGTVAGQNRTRTQRVRRVRGAAGQLRPSLGPGADASGFGIDAQKPMLSVGFSRNRGGEI